MRSNLIARRCRPVSARAQRLPALWAAGVRWPWPQIPASPALQIGGDVDQPFELAVAELASLPRDEWTSPGSVDTGSFSQKMLTQTLRALERDGVVSRTVYPTVPLAWNTRSPSLASAPAG
jgi:hypothetical protein